AQRRAHGAADRERSPGGDLGHSQLHAGCARGVAADLPRAGPSARRGYLRRLSARAGDGSARPGRRVSRPQGIPGDPFIDSAAAQGARLFLPQWAAGRRVYPDALALRAGSPHALSRPSPPRRAFPLPVIGDDGVFGGFSLVWGTARRLFPERVLRGPERVPERVGFFLRTARLY